MRPVATIAGIALCLAPFAIQQSIFPTVAEHGAVRMAATMAALTLATIATSVAGLCAVAAGDVRKAPAMFARVLLQRESRRRAKVVQAAVDCDRRLRRTVEGPHALHVPLTPETDLDHEWTRAASDETRRQIRHAFRGRIGRAMGTVTATISPLPESATMAAAELARARTALEALPNRAKGPSSDGDRTRES